MMMGRGLVHPVDLHHAENPPADPELLDLLAREFVAMRYDMKAFLRELALTRVYQRSSEPPPARAPATTVPAARPSRSLPSRPQTPEQLAWSVMQGLGLVAQTRLQVEEKLDGHDPKMRAILQTDARRRALRATMIEEGVHDQLQAQRRAVRAAICRGGRPAPGCDRADGPPGPVPQQRPARSRPGWLHRAAAWSAGSPRLADASAIADELYLSLYTRRPTDEERAEVARYLARPRQGARARLARAGLGPAGVDRVSIQPLISHSRAQHDRALGRTHLTEETQRCVVLMRADQRTT